MRQITLACLCALGVCLSAGTAFTGSKLWSQRDKKSPPLAQVPDFRTLAEKTRPCVVSIGVRQKARVSRGQQEFFHDFFRGQIPREYHNRGIGSGFAIRADGLILTNNHVVENADTMDVTFVTNTGDEKKLEATLVGAAPEYDVALIKTKEKAKVPICYLGDSNETQIGDWVMAVGNPFGLSHSVSVGIISAKERRGINPSGRSGLYDFLQTDASINPGNSGGPLINMSGEVVGINTAINAAGSGIGFAIPVNMVKALIPSLNTHGKYVRSWIGIKIQALNNDLAKTYGLKSSKGALVSEVVPDSPAEDAGLQEGDIVLEFNGKQVRDQGDLPLYASMAGVGAKAKIVVWRNKRRQKKSITLEAFPEDEVALAQGPEESGEALGIVISDITPELQREFRLEQSRGVLIKDVERGSAAQRSGLRAGDIILSVNGKPVTLARDFAQFIKTTKRGERLRIHLKRPRGKLFLVLRKP